VVSQVAKVGAELQRVSALDPGQVVDDLVGTVFSMRWNSHLLLAPVGWKPAMLNHGMAPLVG